MKSVIDLSQDPRIEDPTNPWLFDRAAVAVMPTMIRIGVSANMVSVGGLLTGALAALAYAHWADHRWALVGLLLSMLWLVMDSLDGKIARATNSCSAFGRELDGMCDYGVFILIYCAIAGSIGTRADWALAIMAGVAHAIQASFYEAERGRFYRRLRGEMDVEPTQLSKNPLARLHDRFTGSFAKEADWFDHSAARNSRPEAFGAAYAMRAVPTMRLMVPLTQNSRVFVIFVACLFRDPAFFWWFELVPLTALTVFGVSRLRRLEGALMTPHLEPLSLAD